ncbi:MAG: hypothetical protein IT548_08525 [Alphaproteobacteria bacterium]|nr:hypothetical protein [Alphaproteobacteria bacterium]
MDGLSWMLAVAGGPLIILAFGYPRAARTGGQRLQSLVVAAGMALAVNIALDVIRTILFAVSAAALDDPLLSFGADGLVFVSPLYLASIGIVAHIAWGLMPRGIREDSRIVALPEDDALPFVAGALLAAATGLWLAGRTEPPVSLSTYAALSLFVFGFYWPMLAHALEEDEPSAKLPWQTITLAAAVALNPLPDLWDALRSGGETLSKGMIAWLVSQFALLVLLGVVRARAKSVLAVLLVAFGGHFAAVVAGGLF